MTERLEGKFTREDIDKLVKLLKETNKLIQNGIRVTTSCVIRYIEELRPYAENNTLAELNMEKLIEVYELRTKREYDMEK